MVKRVVVGAHYGFRDWLAQRVTAAYMAVYTIVVGIALWVVQPTGFAAWKAFMTNGLMRFATFIFLVSLIYHAWVGVRDILMDYISGTALRLTLQVIVILVLVGYTGWGLQILWRA